MSLNSRTVDRSPQKVMFYFQDEEWTFQQVEDYSNQVASLFPHVFCSCQYHLFFSNQVVPLLPHVFCSVSIISLFQTRLLITSSLWGSARVTQSQSSWRTG